MEPLCDADCAFTFTREEVIVRDKKGTAILTGWREATEPMIWLIDLQPEESNLPAMLNNYKQATLAAYITYDLPSVAALFRYFHAAAEFPVSSAWIKGISAGNYSSWTGINLSNTTQYCPSAKATIMGHLVPKHQGIRSTDTNFPPSSSPEEPMPQLKPNKIFIQITPISKLYTDNTCRLPVYARCGHQYVMITYHCDANMILAVPFKTSKDTHRLKSYDKIMQRLRNYKFIVDLQILDNEASAEYKRVIKNKWNFNYQLVPHNTHRSNTAERSICTFKANFISIFSGFAPDLPHNLWDLFLPQTEVTLNLLRKATLDPYISAWAYFHGPFNYDATPLGNLGFNIIDHNKTGTRNSWDIRGIAGRHVGIEIQHYQCHTIVSKATKAAQVSDTVELRHHHLTL